MRYFLYYVTYVAIIAAVLCLCRIIQEFGMTLDYLMRYKECLYLACLFGVFALLGQYLAERK